MTQDEVYQRNLKLIEAVLAVQELMDLEDGLDYQGVCNDAACLVEALEQLLERFLLKGITPIEDI